MDVNSVFGGDTLKSADLQGREIKVTIASVEVKAFDQQGGGNKLLIKFVGAKKAFLCNRTNAKRITLLYGPETSMWVGKQIGLAAEMVDFKGDAVMGIRVRPPAQSAGPATTQQPAQTPPPRDPDPMPDSFGDEIPF
jgi:hypothetical protein